MLNFKLYHYQNFWIVEIGKYIMGGIIGALIALGIKRIDKSGESKSGSNTIQPTKQESAYTKKDTSLPKQNNPHTSTKDTIQ